MKIREATIWLYFVIFVKFFAIFKHYTEKTAEWIFAKFWNWVLFINHYGLVKSNSENFEIWPFAPPFGAPKFWKNWILFQKYIFWVRKNLYAKSERNLTSTKSSMSFRSCNNFEISPIFKWIIQKKENSFQNANRKGNPSHVWRTHIQNFNVLRFQKSSVALIKVLQKEKTVTFESVRIPMHVLISSAAVMCCSDEIS